MGGYVGGKTGQCFIDDSHVRHVASAIQKCMPKFIFLEYAMQVRSIDQAVP